MEKSETMRTRMHVSVNAKGYAQWEVTAEYDTPETAAKQLGSAIDGVRAVIKEKGLTEASAAA